MHSREPGDCHLLPRSLYNIWLIAVAGMAGLCLARIATLKHLMLSDYFLVRQDLPVLAITAALLFALSRWRAPPAFKVPNWPSTTYLILVITLVLVIGATGWLIVFTRYPLSMDEFWADFDAAIFRRGSLLARIDPQWRPFVPELQPMWRIEVQGNTHWASLYLPINAAGRALLGAGNLAGLTSPAWAAVGTAATFGVARRLWPDRRDAALVALGLLATSSQLLVTAMTPYAMSAHFGLNMVWLWLFLRDRPWAHAAAAGVGFAACGIHQLIFHPLFVFPFVVELWLARRWRAATFYMCAYAAIGLFWINYWNLVLASAGAAPAAAQGVGQTYFLTRVVELIHAFDPAGLGIMAENLLRFTLWQNPLMLPLAMLGAPFAARAHGPLRPLLAGMGLTIIAMSVLLPWQGHGWGYRYLHGFLGSLALLAASGWVALRSPRGERPWRGGVALIAISCCFSLTLLLPVRGWQAHNFVAPYARAYARIRASRAEVVIVDPVGLWYGEDLIRNEPFLQDGPKVIALRELRPAMLERLCTSRRIALFDRRAGLEARIPSVPENHTPEDERLLNQLTADLRCRRALAVL